MFACLTYIAGSEFDSSDDKKKQLELLAKLKKKYPGSNDID